MNLAGSAKLWFHILKNPVETLSWHEFVAAVCLHFDKDEHNQLLRAFFHIRQSAYVTEYIEQFSDILHQLLVHDQA